MALEDYFEDFIMQNWISRPDGFGGVEWDVTDGAPFRAGIATANSTEAQIAYRNGLKTIYTIVHPKVLELEQNDRVKRMKDGRIYRITSNSADMATPAVAFNEFSQATAEVVEA